MDIFISKGTILFRGSDNLQPILQGISWFAYTEDDAKLYGKNVSTYKVKKDLHLLNPMSPIFHAEYMTKLNDTFTGTNFNGIDDKKNRLGLPFGLPDYESQLNFLKKKRVKLEEIEDWTKEHDVALSWCNNKHRYSEYSRDMFSVTAMAYVYHDKYDGYATKTKWPSKLHNGLFMKEICVFDYDSCIEIVSKVKYGGGRGKQIQIRTPLPHGATWYKFDNHNYDFEKAHREIFGGMDPIVMENLRK